MCNNDCSWIFILLIILFCGNGFNCGNNGCGNGCGNSCGNDCSCGC